MTVKLSALLGKTVQRIDHLEVTLQIYLYVNLLGPISSSSSSLSASPGITSTF